MARRKQLPIRQRHTDGCRGRDCGCPWSFRVRLPDNSQPRVTRDSYDDAEQAYHELMARRPEPLADRTTTIAQWAERWLASGPSRGWRRNTLRLRRSTVANHIIPELGHYLVTELRRDDVRLWAAAMAARGAGGATRIMAADTLTSMFSTWLADDRDLPRGNPVPAGLVKAPPRKEFPPVTAAQVDAIVAVIRADMALMVRAEAFYGARTGEIRALREEDITFTGLDVTAPLAPQLARLADLPADKYDARKPRLRFARKLENDRTEGEIKNKRGNRVLPLPQWLAAALAGQFGKWPPHGGWLFVNRSANAAGPGRIRTADIAQAAGVAPSSAAVMLQSRRSGNYSEATRRRVAQAAATLGYHSRGYLPYSAEAYRSAFARAAAEAGVTLPKGQCTHALRHHCVSVLRAAGWSDQDIGHWIGDAAQTVTQVYGRPMPDAMDRISAQLSAARDVPRLRVAE